MIFQQTNKIVNHGLKFNGSYRSLEHVSKVVNSTPNAAVKVPSTIYKIKQLLVPVFESTIHIKCKKCFNYISINNSEGECVVCNSWVKAIDSDYFTYIPIKEQIIHSLSNDIDDIIDYYQTVCIDNVWENEMRDIHNSLAFQNAKKKYPSHFILPLTINTDGAQPFAQFGKSLWLIQAYQCYLRPQKRFLIKNILLLAVHFSKDKISMNDFFYPLLRDLDKINEEGGIILTHKSQTMKFMPLIFNICCDLPATCSLLQMNGHSGRFACSKCLHPGELVKSDTKKSAVIRYINGLYAQREHNNFMQIYDKIKSQNKQPIRGKHNKSINGIHGISCLVSARNFDFVVSVSIDHMHCAELGVMKKVLHLWLDSKNHNKPFYIIKKNQELLNKRLIGIKTISEFSRKPREITKFGEFKANELREIMLYYLRFAVSGLINSKYVKHFHLFCSSMYMLMTESISKESIEEADKRLNIFVDEFEILYGRENITMNIHLIRHMASTVRNCGPLWAQSAYGFESNNGNIVRSNTSKRDIAHSITWKYIQKITSQSANATIKQFKVGNLFTVQLNPDEKELYSNFGIEMKEKQLIYQKLVLNGVVFKSLKCKKVSTIDYFIQTKDGQLGVVQHYLNGNSYVYALTDMFDIVNDMDHFKEVKKSGLKKVFRLNDIKCKMIYMKFGMREYVSQRANTFEKS